MVEFLNRRRAVAAARLLGMNEEAIRIVLRQEGRADFSTKLWFLKIEWEERELEIEAKYGVGPAPAPAPPASPVADDFKSLLTGTLARFAHLNENSILFRTNGRRAALAYARSEAQRFHDGQGRAGDVYSPDLDALVRAELAKLGPVNRAKAGAS
jgi:hypothetical protein